MRITGADPAATLPVLKTSRLALRPLRRGDAGAIERLAGDWAVARFTASVPHPYAEGMGAAWLSSLGKAGPHSDEIVMAIERRFRRSFMGCIGLRRGEDGRSGDLGFWLGRRYWGNGFMSEAVAAFLGFAFADLGLERVEAAAMPENQPSIRVQEKMGFAFHRREMRPAPARGGSVAVEVRVLERGAFGRAGHDPAAADRAGCNG
jgi:RimJ/RimL family protein N-acetyltransferase